LKIVHEDDNVVKEAGNEPMSPINQKWVYDFRYKSKHNKKGESFVYFCSYCDAIHHLLDRIRTHKGVCKVRKERKQAERVAAQEVNKNQQSFSFVKEQQAHTVSQGHSDN